MLEGLLPHRLPWRLEGLPHGLELLEGLLPHRLPWRLEGLLPHGLELLEGLLARLSHGLEALG